MWWVFVGVVMGLFYLTIMWYASLEHGMAAFMGTIIALLMRIEGKIDKQ